MGKLAWVFAGQGAQKPGMGRALYAWHPAIRATMDRLDGIRPGTLQQCFEGSEAELKDTLNAQPCIYALSAGIAAALRQDGASANMAAGFSLGEVSALNDAGLFQGDDGFRFVTRRAGIMAKLAQEKPGAMAAVLRLEDHAVERLCQDIGGLWPVNYNSPGQLVVAGSDQAIGKLAQAVQLAGGRLMPLAVSGAFHSPYMDEAQPQLLAALADYQLQPLRLPVYANLTAVPYGNRPAFILSQQVNHPVRWQQTIRAMIADGADRFIEVGPGNTLAGLIKRIDSSVKVLSVNDQESYEAARALAAQEASDA